MSTTAKFEPERQELATVLASGIFDRAPALARLLQYICEKYFEGEAGQIKEYNIAVEALGRPAEFDQKRDSIVRVEAHLLRKRLKEYYEAQGSAHALRIVIPAGQYAPKFAVQETITPSHPALLELSGDGSPTPEAKQILPPAEIERRPLPKKSALFAALGILGVALAVPAAIWVRNPARLELTPASAAASSLPGQAVASGPAIRILAGYTRPAHLDRLGQVWISDRYFHGGEAVTCPRQLLSGTPDRTIYRHCRRGNFSYDIPLQPGSYELHLYFGPSLTPWSLEESAVKYPIMVGINKESHTFLIDFSHEGRANSNPDVRILREIGPAPDGFLHLSFAQAGTQFAFVNAIEILPGTGRLLPVRLTASESFYTDTRGNLWGPDRFFHGGTLVERRDEISGTEDPDLFATERYGTRFDYVIPVADTGTYSVTLGFAETWFGPNLPGGGGIQSRLFDVSANGAWLIKNLDVYKEAGGAHRALLKTFGKIHPDADGKLRLVFAASRNFAMVNFIQVDDELSLKRSPITQGATSQAKGTSEPDHSR